MDTKEDTVILKFKHPFCNQKAIGPKNSHHARLKFSQKNRRAEEITKYTVHNRHMLPHAGCTNCIFWLHKR